MTVTTSPGVAGDYEERVGSFSNRLSKVGTPQIGSRVKVVAVGNIDYVPVVGREGRLIRVDGGDSTLTYGVNLDDWEGVPPGARFNDPDPTHSFMWVHDVALLEDSGEVTALNARVTELETLLTTARQREQAEADELVQFKQLVVDTAVQAAADNEWCDVVKNLIENDLGLTWPDKRVTFTVRVDVEMSATFTGSGMPDSSTVSDDLSLDGVYIEMGGNWEDVRVEDHSVNRVTDVESE